MAIQLSFGTAGIRAPLGPGDDQINPRTVRAIAHALCTHLTEIDPGARGRGLCVGYDGRTDSDLLARVVIELALRHGFRVRAFEAPVPTPLLAFCTRFYGAAAGVMITASHNPPEDSGVKVYLQGGAQVLAPHDRAIAERLSHFDPALLDALPTPSGSPTALGELEVDAYLDAMATLVPVPSASALPGIAYSALAGVGGELARRVFARTGALELAEVEAEARPRADFAGLTNPNPEHPEALARLLTLMDEQRIDLGFAHDPDADRLAVVVRERAGSLRALSGDQVGALLGTFMLRQSAEPTRDVLVSSLVSGELLERVARAHGARFERTPTGFKWIASRGRALERELGLTFLFGYEEAIGYAFGATSDDKDGLAALYVLLELARREHAEGRTLLDALDALSTQHGLFESRQVTLPRTAAGAGPDLLARLRGLDASTLLGPGALRIDYAEGPSPIDLLVLQSEEARVCIRPSGTEPKLKIYLHTTTAVQGSIDEARERARATLDALERRIRALS